MEKDANRAQVLSAVDLGVGTEMADEYDHFSLGDAKNLLFPSEESKDDKWPIIFPVLRFVLIRPSFNLREPLERSFNV
jgi:hypothetical protein